MALGDEIIKGRVAEFAEINFVFQTPQETGIILATPAIMLFAVSIKSAGVMSFISNLFKSKTVEQNKNELPPVPREVMTLQEYRSGLKVGFIAKTHDRSYGAIKARIEKLTGKAALGPGGE